MALVCFSPQDISGRVIAEGLRPEETSMAKVMTRTPVFVMSNSSATEALHKMVQGHPVHFYKTLKTFQTMCKTTYFVLSETTYKSERREYQISGVVFVASFTFSMNITN